MLKTKYEININGINVCIEGEYENYEALDNERNSLVNSVIFAFNDISKKIQYNSLAEVEKPLKTAISPVKRVAQPSAPATASQVRYLGVLGYSGSTDLTYQEANQLIRQFKAGAQNMGI